MGCGLPTAVAPLAAEHGLQSVGLAGVVHRLSYSVACGIFHMSPALQGKLLSAIFGNEPEKLEISSFQDPAKNLFQKTNLEFKVQKEGLEECSFLTPHFPLPRKKRDKR